MRPPLRSQRKVIGVISRRLADFIYETDFGTLPKTTVHMAKLAFLDWLGSTAAGGRQAPFQKALAVLREQGGAPQATLLPVWEKTSCLNAALGNGLASHIVELDDVHRAAIIHWARPSPRLITISGILPAPAVLSARRRRQASCWV